MHSHCGMPSLDDFSETPVENVDRPARWKKEVFREKRAGRQKEQRGQKDSGRIPLLQGVRTSKPRASHGEASDRGSKCGGSASPLSPHAASDAATLSPPASPHSALDDDVGADESLTQKPLASSDV